MAGKSGRVISAQQQFSIKRSLMKWEAFLLLVFVLVNIMNVCISPYYLSVNGLFTATSSFLEKAFIVLPMAYILLLGEIDISVGATVALSACMLGITYNAGLPMGAAVVVCLLVGTACGLFNGLMLTRFTELAPMILTLGSQILYRGIAEILLTDKGTGGFTAVKWFQNLYWGKIGVVPIMFLIFVICAILFGIVMHKTTFGRWMYAIGSNARAAKYSGIRVQRIRCIVYTLTGAFSAVTAVFLASRMGSVRSNIAEGYELEAISMVVLGGVLTDGGKGNFPGVVIAIFVLGFLRYGLGLANIPSQVMMVIIGLLLIVAVMLPNLAGKIRKSL
ncbi:ABC transporter permease [Diplocloster modestus]|uniref:Autoinducer 2 import system permease protein LsrD n=1 Tax=Diplocloster modestus TaxID=2850322 RepID=A0ABS6K1E8_9FIRM|nr:ABC transporter permease [Diplocloster modestus]MBU9724676.1 ABC transporter permease [Diplocloster modestus]